MRAATASLALLLASLGAAQAAAQFGARYQSIDAPKVQLFVPAPNEPAAPVIVPQREAPPAVQDNKPTPAPAPRPPAAAGGGQTGAGAPFFVPGSRTAPAAAPSAGPQTTVEGFYRTYLQVRGPGIPNASLRARLRPFLTPALDAAIAGAEQAENTHRARTGGNEPPLVEGDLFVSLFEGASDFRVQECSDVPSGARCVVRLSHTDPTTNQNIEWRDTAMLTRTGGGWRISDIVFGGKFLLGQTGQLTEVLDLVARQVR